MSKTAAGLVAYCQAQLGRPYWFGTFGNIAGEALYKAKKAQYPAYYTASDFPAQYGRRVHDCVGLIKGYRWSDGPEAVPAYNARQDVSVSGLYAQCGKRGAVKSLPDVPGVCVFMTNMSHVGVYVGDGYVIEARGHAYGVVKTKLSERGWGLWGMPDWLDYEGAAAAGAAPDPEIAVTAKQLRSGSSGSAVKKLQLLLTGLGHACGGADGDFGPKTRTALTAFQKAAGLAQDGVCGPATWGKLLA